MNGQTDRRTDRQTDRQKCNSVEDLHSKSDGYLNIFGAILYTENSSVKGICPFIPKINYINILGVVIDKNLTWKNI